MGYLIETYKLTMLNVFSKWGRIFKSACPWRPIIGVTVYNKLFITHALNWKPWIIVSVYKIVGRKKSTIWCNKLENLTYLKVADYKYLRYF